MNRIISAFLVVIVVFMTSLGCEKQQAAAPGSATQPATGKKIRIGVSVPAADHGWTAGIGYWAKTEMAKYPDVEWIYATAYEPAKQTSDIEDMMTQGIEA